MACIRTNAACVETKGFVGTLVGAGDVASLKEKPAEAAVAEQILNKARFVMQEQGVNDIKALGKFDVQVAKTLLGKLETTEGAYVLAFFVFMVM